MQQLTLLLAAHVRHGLIWSSLPLPQDSSVRQPDKPWIFSSHSDPKLFGVWCYFYLHLTHLCSIFVTPLSSDPPLSPIALLRFPGTHPILRNSESSYSFYFYLPPMFIIGYGPCADQLPISAVLRSLPVSYSAYSAPCFRYPRSVHYRRSTTRLSQPSSYRLFSHFPYYSLYPSALKSINYPPPPTI